MDFLPGFTWAIPTAFSDAVFQCCFEEGDILYDTPLAYEGMWGDVKNNIKYFLQIKHPARGYSSISSGNGVFEANWNSEVRLELYKNHEKVSIGQIHTTQGKLYSALWKGDLTVILNNDSKTPKPPINIQQVTKNLGDTSIVVRKLSKGKPAFVMIKDDTSPISHEKYYTVKNILSKHLNDEPIILSPKEAGITNSENIAPTIQIALFITEKISTKELEELIKKEVYTPSKNAKTDKFRISSHGRIFPDNSELTFIYQDAKGNITKRDIYSISNSDEYIQGICRKTNSIRTFRKDRILEYVSDINLAEERLEYFIKTNPTPPTIKTTLPNICFTGFKKLDKDNLIKLAQQQSMTIRSSVTKNLAFLCCGYNAGPKKIETARNQGAIVLNENQFRTMLETGELPEK